MDKEIMPKSIDSAIQNITDTPTKEIGNTLGDIWFLVFGGLSHAADKKRMKYAYSLEKYKKELEEATDNIPIDRRIEPSIQITAQALEASKYCVEADELRKMFVNLISGSLDRKYENEVHPSFPEILKQLNEKDARFLKIMSEKTSIPVVDLGIEKKIGEYRTIARSVLLPYGELSSKECTIAASSLERAGLLRINTGLESFADSDRYKPFEELDIYRYVESEANKNSESVYMSEGVCQLTNLGMAFIKVCVR